jgi:hypothetical protein
MDKTMNGLGCAASLFFRSLCSALGGFVDHLVQNETLAEVDVPGSGLCLLKICQVSVVLFGIASRQEVTRAMCSPVLLCRLLCCAIHPIMVEHGTFSG